MRIFFFVVIGESRASWARGHTGHTGDGDATDGVRVGEGGPFWVAGWHFYFNSIT